MSGIQIDLASLLPSTKNRFLNSPHSLKVKSITVPKNMLITKPVTGDLYALKI